MLIESLLRERISGGKTNEKMKKMTQIDETNDVDIFYHPIESDQM